MIEMLVVVAIICICVSLTIPYFVEAQRGAGLRTSSQTVIMTAKYARSMAILKQIDLALLVDRGQGQLELVSFNQPAASSDQDFFMEQRSSRTFELSREPAAAGDGEAEPVPEAPPPSIKTELIRDLAEGITVKELEVEGEDSGRRDVSWVFFNRNGTSSGFKIRIEDSRGSAAEVEMDGISGLVTTKMLGRDDR